MLSRIAFLIQGQVGRLHKSCPQTLTEDQQEEIGKALKLSTVRVQTSRGQCSALLTALVGKGHESLIKTVAQSSSGVLLSVCLFNFKKRRLFQESKHQCEPLNT